jgi:sulfide:quinone oxidoreductase
MPLGVPIPPSPSASKALLEAFAQRDIAWHPERLVRRLDPDRKVAVFSDESEMAYDLFLGVPVHRVPTVVEESGLAVDGWVPVNPLTLETTFPDVYAVGDVTSVGTPKAGVFAEGQASVVAGQIVAKLRARPATTTYDGHGVCYLEFGHGQVARVSVTFLSGAAPVGDLEGPSLEIAGDKDQFGTSRVARWFGRTWS